MKVTVEKIHNGYTVSTLEARNQGSTANYPTTVGMLLAVIGRFDSQERNRIGRLLFRKFGKSQGS